jgi:hypothetical protein
MMSKLNSGEDIDATFQNLKNALATRIERGVRTLPQYSMRDLVLKLDENTIRHDYDEMNGILQEELLEQKFMGNRSILHQPATEEEIQSLEQRLGVELPEDYKEFLRISNGLEGIWNGYHHQGHLGSTNDVQWSELIWGDVQEPLPLELVDWTELPFKVDWPAFDLRQAISIHNPSDECNPWLVKPELAKQAVAKLFEAYEGLGGEDKETARKVFGSYFGSIEALREMEWCVVTWTHWGIVLTTWKSFREFVETLVTESES